MIYTVRGDGVDEVVDGVLGVDDDERGARVAPHNVVQRPRQRVEALLARVHGRHHLQRPGGGHRRPLAGGTVIHSRSGRHARRCWHCPFHVALADTAGLTLEGTYGRVHGRTG